MRSVLSNSGSCSRCSAMTLTFSSFMFLMCPTDRRRVWRRVGLGSCLRVLIML